MNRSLWVGLALIIIGILLLLEAIGIIPSLEWILQWWPVLLIAAGIRLVLRRPERLPSGLFIIAIGCLILADNIIAGFDFWVAALPVLLIVLGIGLIVRPVRNSATQHATSIAFARSEESLESELINVVAVFGGASHTVISQQFRGGTIQAVFGGIELDLRRAAMATSEASLDIEAFVAGVTIKVPSTWRVTIEGTPIFGGIENRAMTSPVGNEHPVLRIRVTVVFAGIEIE